MLERPSSLVRLWRAGVLGLALLAGPAQAEEPAAEAPAASPAPAPAGAAGAAPAPGGEGVRRIVYLPDALRAQILEEVKREVLEQARREGWAAPGVVPAWASRLKISGDVRGRFDRVILPPGNAPGDQFNDFNAINTGKPFDMKGYDLSADRYLDVDRSRTRPRLRARLGVEVLPREGFASAIRLGSGEGNTPVSNNQTLGGSGGNFSKYQLWLDRAFVRFAPEAGVLEVTLGRFDNPFLGTDLVWWDDLSFDGLAVQVRRGPDHAVVPFVTAGAFPVYTTALSFPGERAQKFHSWNKWLYAAQVGARVTTGARLSGQLAVALYDFEHVTGRPSSPCDTNLSYVSCDTDDLRPSFAQKGNSYKPLRTPSADALDLESTSSAPRYQYFGLASRFRELVVTGKAQVRVSGALSLGLEGEYVYNLGFRRSELEGNAYNNRGPISGTSPLGRFAGGNHGLLARAGLGTPELRRRWDWRARFTFRRLESDAVMDAFNDPDFGQGGTNLEGYSVDLTLGLATDVTAAARWFSAKQVAGPRYAVDGLQLDLTQRF